MHVRQVHRGAATLALALGGERLATAQSTGERSPVAPATAATLPSEASVARRRDSAQPEGSAASPGGGTTAGGPRPAEGSQRPVTTATEGTAHPGTSAGLTLSGYAEVFYQWNFNEPDNGITNYRGFDTRHNAITLSNVVIDASGSLGPVTARLAIQFGHTPETYYLAEPDRGSASGAGASNMNVWKFLQQANIAWRAPLGRGLLLEAGLFLSPIGPESMAVHDQWNWSRSNLFFGLPFYHTGLRASYPLTDQLTASLAVYNGWNSVLDNNGEKSFAAALDYVVTDRVTFHAMYFGGVERAPGAPERQGGATPWRSVLDTYFALYPTRWLSVLVHANAGFEPNSFGTSYWAAGALYARVRPARWLYLTARGDFFYESAASSAVGSASSIFWPAPWVSSQTVTADFRPHENVSLRVEYRHDHAAGDLYFRGAVVTDAVTRAFIPNARTQDTLTFGTTAWF